MLDAGQPAQVCHNVIYWLKVDSGSVRRSSALKYNEIASSPLFSPRSRNTANEPPTTT